MPRCLWLLSIVLLAGSGGCAPPNVALFSSGADPAFHFPRPAETRVAVLPMRDGTMTRDLTPTLDEKILVDDVAIGLSNAGFRVVRPDADPRPDFIVFCSAQVNVDYYDSYERIPTTDTIVGTHHTRRGYRTYYETVHSSVIVPTTRRYTYSIMRLAVVETAIALDPQAAGTSVDQTAVWYSTIEANGPIVMRERAWQVFEAMALWSRTGQKRLRYPESR